MIPPSQNGRLGLNVIIFVVRISQEVRSPTELQRRLEG